MVMYWTQKNFNWIGAQASSEKLVIDRFLPEVFKNLIKNLKQPTCRDLWRHLV